LRHHLQLCLIRQIAQIHAAFDLAPDDVPVDLIAQVLMRLKHPDFILAPRTMEVTGMGVFYSRSELVEAREQWRAAGKSVVFTNGCYDLLHPGHVRLLERSRAQGDVLILALNADASVSRLKGPSRPLLPEQERVRMVAELAAVDAVVLFEEDTPRELIAAVLPDILIKGADWAHFVAGREEVEAAGGKVVLLSLEPGFSTTNIEKELLARQPRSATHS
jgi:D-beta-D-heptose 7-phosphate kinase/D-beta-D-heptose 1-phosphate adenosyltransferase